MSELSDSERRAILSVADCVIGRAGRTTLVMALRGSRAQRVRQFGVEKTRGYGHFAGIAEEEVMARVDALIAQGILALERIDGFPLLTYTTRGLALAERYAADEWLALIREQVAAMQRGGAFALPLVHAKMPDRNLETLAMVIADMEREVDARWLPFLQAWKAVETKRVRGWLQRVIDVRCGDGAGSGDRRHVTDDMRQAEQTTGEGRRTGGPEPEATGEGVRRIEEQRT